MTKGIALLFLVVLSAWFTSANATNATVTNVSFTGSPTDPTSPNLIVYLTVRWDNAWNNAKNKDGVWLFFKMNQEGDTRTQRHAPVKKTGYSLVHNYVSNSVDPTFFVPDHAAGILVFPSAKYRGTIQWRLKIELDLQQMKSLDFANIVFGSAHAAEMVYIPEGPFYVGDSDSFERDKNSAIHDFNSKEPVLIGSEKAITIGKNTGELYYDNKEIANYRGDMQGTIPDVFPKGFKAFWIMKYELTQGQYAAFLNSISNTPTQTRANFGGKAYYDERGTISFDDGQYKAGSPDRPANYISWDDGCAFADWAGLRPFTELEYEKAARGTKKPVAADFPWGNSSRDKVSRYYNDVGDLVMEKGFDEKDLNDTNLEFFGASPYWVMDLSGSVWERIVSIGSEKGRSFKATHGDGTLGPYGVASNEDWPSNKDGGLGYRGSGYYGLGMRGDPFHRVAARPFAAWGDGPRSVGYGFRAALSAQ